MSIGEVIGNIGLVLTVLIFIIAGVCAVYSEINMEYKYTADVPCYDKEGSVINELTCKYKVICGPWGRSVPFRDKHFSCDKDDTLVEVDE